MTERGRRWQPAYIGVGSNLDDPVAQVVAAFDGLAALDGCRLYSTSDLYWNPPMGPQDQPDYVNGAAGLLTTLAPLEMLAALQALETRLGRIRTEGDRWGPRIIDLDLLVYGTQALELPGLELPHPGISERNFVLFPLCDIAPTLAIPGQGVVASLARQMSRAGLQEINNQTRKRA
jgi:2-amino-4-hydroxy-6-hydroxymethyldihydropteridine diphosphokinase